MSTHRHTAEIVLNWARRYNPKFKRSHAYHVTARLHGLRNAQTLNGTFSAPALLADPRLTVTLDAALREYKVALSDVDLNRAAFDIRRQRDGQPDIRARVQDILKPWDVWCAEPATLLTFLFEQLGPQASNEDIAESLAREALPLIRDLAWQHPELRVLPPRWLRTARALEAKLRCPALKSPYDLVVEITEVRRPGEARGRVISSPTWPVTPGAPFDEVLLLIPNGAAHQHQEEQAFLYERAGTLIHSRSVRHGKEREMPLRRVGQYVSFPMPRAGVHAPAWVKTAPPTPRLSR